MPPKPSPGRGATGPEAPESSSAPSSATPSLEALAAALAVQENRVTANHAAIVHMLQELKDSINQRSDSHEQRLADISNRLTAVEQPDGATASARRSLPPHMTLPRMMQARSDGRHLLGQQADNAPLASTVDAAATTVPSAHASDHASSFKSQASVAVIADDDHRPRVPDDKWVVCKAETLGEFGGDPLQLEDFIERLKDASERFRGRNWECAVLSAIPDALKGPAKDWHLSLGATERGQLTSIAAFIAALRDAFPIDRVNMRREALDRRWQPRTETAVAYTYSKVRMLRQAYGADISERLLVDELLAGLEPSMRALVRVPRTAYTVVNVRAELSDHESVWRDLHKIRINAVTTVASHRERATSAGSAKPAATPAVTPAASDSATGRGRRYDPSRVVEAKGSEPRMYRRDNGTFMRLGRPCGRCGEQHFDFEHDYVKSGGKAFPMVPEEDDEAALHAVGDSLTSDF
ncbi:hypothetical protein OC835_007383 [Tilletia horrida]|nr:hypothetical protein OC835_007383 [Tilletia horrida]